MNTLHKTLLTPELRARLREVGNQQSYNPLMIAKFYNPVGNGNWFLSDYIAKEDKYIAYYMDKNPRRDDWVYITEAELQALRFSPGDVGLERDLTFTERNFSELPSPRRT